MDAKAIMIASFATSEGWKLKIPIWIQRFAPYPSVPNSATRISRKHGACQNNHGNAAHRSDN